MLYYQPCRWDGQKGPVFIDGGLANVWINKHLGHFESQSWRVQELETIPTDTLVLTKKNYDPIAGRFFTDDKERSERIRSLNETAKNWCEEVLRSLNEKT